MIELTDINFGLTQVIPTLNDGSAFYTMRIQLSGVTFGFAFKFSTREQVWYLDIYDTNNNPLLLSIKLIQGYILSEYQLEYYGLPTLAVLTGLQSAQNPPGLYDLGSAWKLVFIPPGAV